MPLYRALYQSKNDGNKTRAMTFAAETAEQAAQIAHDWQLPSDRLLTLKPVMAKLPAGTQLTLIEG